MPRSSHVTIAPASRALVLGALAHAALMPREESLANARRGARFVRAGGAA
jgi:hypothetical protein